MQVKLFIFGLMCAFGSSTLHADYDVNNLQNLFTDKKKRAQIDAARSGHYSRPAAKKTNRVKMSGYVTRSNGKSVVWVNNKNTLESESVGNVNVQQSSIGKNKKVGVTAGGAHIRLKPGQTWSKSSGISDITK